LETVRGLDAQRASRAADSTGVLFLQQTTESLVDAVRIFESVESEFSSPFIKRSVEHFDVDCFTSKMSRFIAGKMKSRGNPIGRSLVTSFVDSTPLDGS
jgi:hypothetical protein